VESRGKSAHPTRPEPPSRREPGRRSGCNACPVKRRHPRAAHRNSFHRGATPALFTTMWSTRKVLHLGDERPRIRRSAGSPASRMDLRALRSNSAAAAPAPRNRAQASTRAVARLTWAKNASCTPGQQSDAAGRLPSGFEPAWCPARLAVGELQRRLPCRQGGAVFAAPCVAPACAAAACESPSASVSATPGCDCAHPSRVREHGEERGTRKRGARQARTKRRSTCGRTCSIRRLYCTPEGHASTHAMQPRHASQWAHHLLVHAHLTARSEIHEQDAAPRGIHLLTPEQVCGTRGKAEPAVHAIGDQGGVGRAMFVERDGFGAGSRVARGRGRTGGRCAHVQMPPALAARAQGSAGSSWRFTERMSSERHLVVHLAARCRVAAPDDKMAAGSAHRSSDHAERLGREAHLPGTE